ncbi:MAG: YjbH domain-containing protein [Bacteroidetes bacterium]|nr:YjbH domain-containing protein [Bacteroidota bacterium]
MFIKLFILFFAITFPCFFLHGQAYIAMHSDQIVMDVVKKGYENVRVNQRNDTLFIGLENRVWRWESRAVAEILKVVMPGADSNVVISITLLNSGIPVSTIIVARKQYDNLLADRVPADLFADSITARLSDREYRSSLGHLHGANSSFFKFDIIVSPQLKAQFGNFVHPLEIQFNVVPALQVAFTRGMSLTAQVILPVFNNLIGDAEANTIRPGLVVLNQSFRLPYQIFTSVSAGYFSRNRYGLSGEARKFWFNGKLGVGATLGYTGQMQLLEGLFTYTPVDVFSWFCDASWRFAAYDLTIHAGYGGFIGRDQGWRADVVRQFGEVSIGFFAMQTDGVMNGGFNFIIPLPPRKYGTKNRIRVRPASYVPWEYRAKGLPSYGRTFNTGYGTEEWMFNLNPDDIRKQLGKQLLIN